MPKYDGDFGINDEKDSSSMVVEIAFANLPFGKIQELLEITRRAKFKSVVDVFDIFEKESILYIYAVRHTDNERGKELSMQRFAELRSYIRRAGIRIDPDPCHIDVPPELLADRSQLVGRDGWKVYVG